MEGFDFVEDKEELFLEESGSILGSLWVADSFSMEIGVSSTMVLFSPELERLYFECKENKFLRGRLANFRNFSNLIMWLLVDRGGGGLE